jgi:hypothetical protein
MLARVAVARVSLVLMLGGAGALNGQTGAMLPSSAPDYDKSVATRLPHEAVAALYIAQPSRGAVRVDGYLSEAVWSQAVIASRFIQSAPRAGAQASERTEVRVMTTEPGLLIGARFFDSDVGKIVTESGVQPDLIELSFDTSHNHRDALVLTVSAGGERHAALVKDGVRRDLPSLKWTASAHVSSLGWSAEILLPYDALGDDVVAATTWGWQVRRFIARKNEWSSYPALQSGDAANVAAYAHLLVLGGKPKR